MINTNCEYGCRGPSFRVQNVQNQIVISHHFDVLRKFANINNLKKNIDTYVFFIRLQF